MKEQYEDKQPPVHNSTPRLQIQVLDSPECVHVLVKYKYENTFTLKESTAYHSHIVASHLVAQTPQTTVFCAFF